MTEQNRIIKLFEEHYNGSPWLDVNITDQLNALTAEEASRSLGQSNSIWQLVYHMMCWRKQNMKRLSGKIAPAPSHNFIIPFDDQSPKAWASLLKAFEKTHHTFIKFLLDFDVKKFDNIYEGNGHSYYEHITGILVHDAYHLGQIVLLQKWIKNGLPKEPIT